MNWKTLGKFQLTKSTLSKLR